MVCYRLIVACSSYMRSHHMYRQSNILSHFAHTYGIKIFLFSYKGTKHLYILQVNHHFFISKTLVTLLFLYRNITRIQDITMYNVFLFLVTTSFSHFMHLESGSVGAAVLLTNLLRYACVCHELII